nr:unnamed protein product [Callosobruchus analis]
MNPDFETILIKQEVQTNEINETVDAAHIKLKQGDATYKIQYDGVKVEALNLKNEDGNGPEILKAEYDAIGISSSQLTEESGRVESSANGNATCDLLPHTRIKEEQTKETGCSMATIRDIQVKAEVKTEKIEDEEFIDVAKFEKMDTLDLNEEGDIKPEAGPSAVSDPDCAVKKKAIGIEKRQARSATIEKKNGEEPQVEHTEPESHLYICYDCNCAVPSKIDFIKHIKPRKCTLKRTLGKIQLSNSVACQYCDASFSSTQNLDNHIIKKHYDFMASVNSKIHECTQCNYKTTIKHLLAEHVLKEHPEFIATLKSKIHECAQCNYKTAKRYLLSRHIMTHSSPRSEICTLLCMHCNAPFKSRYKLSNHVLRKHPEHIDPVKVKTHECRRCSYKCLYKSELDRHMRTHTDTVITCIHCYIGFKTMRSLNEHIVRNHSKFLASVSCKIYSCTYCQYKTTVKFNIQRHTAKHPDADLLSYEETS